MSSTHSSNHLNKVTLGGLIVTLGIIYGDIGTSPLYVMKAIVGKQAINPDVVLGAISCIFWTLTIQTTFKYVILTLRADNKGEGGIFSLYTLVKKLKKRWLIVPAILGGSALLADGIITPPISVSSAIEGLRTYNPELNTIPIVIGILFALFFIQRFGTKLVGKFFGPLMLLWFGMLGTLGIIHLMGNVAVLKALNPYYAFHLLKIHHEGFYVLGYVFLCTTGAEALYSDLGHCGIKNIRISWIFVKSMLVINYFGQGAYLISHTGSTLIELSGNANNPGNPFYLVMPDWFLPFGIAIATMAAVIASQALISGSFTLISEAMRLNLWPKVRIKYPTELKGQLYIPSINWLLFIGCVFIVVHFKESGNMEAAYGLAIVMCMIMTTILLGFFMVLKRYNPIFIVLVVSVYLTIEISFFLANIEKFPHGGYVSVFIAGLLAFIMITWFTAKKIRKDYTEFVKIGKFKNVISELSNDLSIPKYATHLVYMTNASHGDEIESKIIYSILQKRPKRADIYWLIHVNVVDEPYEMEYRVREIVKDDIIRVDFYLGFRVAPRINLLFKKVVQDMVKNGEVDITSRYESLNRNNVLGDFKFVLIEKFVSYDNDFPWYQRIILDIYFFLKKISLSEEQAFGLDSSSVKIEQYPIVIHPPEDLSLTRIKERK
ncbi:MULTISPECIES: KUP/HAK/KT family potassium transporter [Flavobacterium]|uniref:KUP/HAK/KT family potassium transporter n=1 Tax=Flavobacterium TaxID=237 RepID=UPI00086C53DB|nr:MULTISPECIES: KUP/HAK/KT family potassium transporter [Flavobacterium]MBN9285407.1 KUP/HAK/KT family potassium transporter [Flavobacterium sp.]ODS85327.1 MAG: potassium transporter Kup [Chryseobacterium sp. SCN 40-13]OJV71687.1 MAG: potassium transporter Kup [Flavobacterium sp. 40-81]